MILDVQGAAGLAEQQFFETKTTENYVKLRYFHFPDLPLLDAETAAVVVTNQSFDLPSVSSIEALVEELNGLVWYDTASPPVGHRVFYVWYNSSEFEICTADNAVTLSASFAGLLKLGSAATILAANTCYSSSLFEGQISKYSHYNVNINGVRGFYTGQHYNSVIAKVRRDGDISAANFHYFKRVVDSIELSISVVKRDGTILPYTAPEIWSLGLEFG